MQAVALGPLLLISYSIRMRPLQVKLALHSNRNNAIDSSMGHFEGLGCILDCIQRKYKGNIKNAFPPIRRALKAQQS